MLSENTVEFKEYSTITILQGKKTDQGSHDFYVLRWSSPSFYSYISDINFPRTTI